MGDAHQDHRLLAQLTHNTFRDHGDLGNPNFFVPLTRAQLRRKIEVIEQHLRASAEEAEKLVFRRDVVCDRSLRGIGCNAPEGLAEAFYSRKIVF